MGLPNAPALFVQIMNNQFINMLEKGVVVSLDNVVIYSYIAEEHLKLLMRVFTYLHKRAIYCKLKKCSYLQKTTTFFGFYITPESMHSSDAKVKSLKEWPKQIAIK